MGKLGRNYKDRVYPISAATTEGLDELVAALDKIV
jgi:hypothetical protein